MRDIGLVFLLHKGMPNFLLYIHFPNLLVEVWGGPLEDIFEDYWMSCEILHDKRIMGERASSL
jgi:hypothetical protein